MLKWNTPRPLTDFGADACLDRRLGCMGSSIVPCSKELHILQSQFLADVTVHGLQLLHVMLLKATSLVHIA